MQLRSAAVQNEIMSRLAPRVRGLLDLAKIWQEAGGLGQAAWEKEASNFYDSVSVKAISRLDASMQLKWIIPSRGNEPLVDFHAGRSELRREAMEAARATGQPRMSHLVRLRHDGRLGFVIYVPTYVGNRFDGFMGASLRVEQLFDAGLKNVAVAACFSIYDGTLEVYRRPCPTNDDALRVEEQTARDIVFVAYGVPLRLHIWPHPSTHQSIYSYLPQMILVGGILLATLFAWLLRLSMNYRLQTVEKQVELVERRRIERALALNDARFRVALRHSNVFVFNQDPELRYTWVYNPPGLNEEDMIGKSDHEIYPAETAAAMTQLKRRVLEAGTAEHREMEAVVNGTPIVFDMVVEPLTENGRVVGLTAAAVNVTPHKQIENQLRQSEARFRAMFENAAIGVMLNDTLGRILETNPTLRAMLGYTSEDLANLSLRDLLNEQEWQASLISISDLQHGQRQFYKQQKHYRRKDGSFLPVAVTVSVIRDSSGAVQNVIRMVEDVTELKAAEVALKSAYAELETRVQQRTAELSKRTDMLARSNTELEQFAYVASHDLKEPLRIISSYVQLLQRRYGAQLDGEALEFIEYAVDGANRMNRLINDLLSYSRISAQKQALEPVMLDVPLKEALQNLQMALREAGAHVESKELPQVSGARSELTQLFQNLIANALKFRSERTPRIVVECRDRGPFWEISVSDNGIGIEPQYFEQIFVIFRRLHTQETYPGTGIGLALCKKIVERHGGSIWLASEPGAGSTFFFTLLKA